MLLEIGVWQQFLHREKGWVVLKGLRELGNQILLAVNGIWVPDSSQPFWESQPKALVVTQGLASAPPKLGCSSTVGRFHQAPLQMPARRAPQSHEWAEPGLFIPPPPCLLRPCPPLQRRLARSPPATPRPQGEHGAARGRGWQCTGWRAGAGLARGRPVPRAGPGRPSAAAEVTVGHSAPPAARAHGALCNNLQRLTAPRPIRSPASCLIRAPPIRARGGCSRPSCERPSRAGCGLTPPAPGGRHAAPAAGGGTACLLAASSLLCPGGAPLTAARARPSRAAHGLCGLEPGSPASPGCPPCPRR